MFAHADDRDRAINVRMASWSYNLAEMAKDVVNTLGIKTFNIAALHESRFACGFDQDSNLRTTFVYNGRTNKISFILDVDFLI